MARKQTNIRLDDLTRAAIKRIAAEHNMSESQVITRAIILLDLSLRENLNVAPNVANAENRGEATE